MEFIVADQRLLEKVELGFVEIKRTPKKLTFEQIDAFNQDGFINGIELYTEQQMKEISSSFDDLFVEGKNYSFYQYHLKSSVLYDIITNPTLLDYVEDIVGPDIMCWSSHFICKVPRDPKKVAWHQDAPYWPITPSRTLAVWIAFDDADRENSALQYIPGSHRVGALKTKQAGDDAVFSQEIEDRSHLREPEYNELKAGTFSLHSDMIAHGSDPNRSDRRRCGLTIRYCSPHIVSPLDPEWAECAIACRGNCDSGNWVFNERPQSEVSSTLN